MMGRAKIGARHQITIPQDVFEELDLKEGDYVEVTVKGDRIEVIPQAMIPRDQKWFWTDEWQEKEREAEQDIRNGEISGPFETASEAIQELKESSD
ncbi:MAG: AbrB/MazE/SpoVT family DNA-binding domain-containing protein [bacterium]